MFDILDEFNAKLVFDESYIAAYQSQWLTQLKGKDILIYLVVSCTKREREQERERERERGSG